jgi:hypothetical protein
VPAYAAAPPTPVDPSGPAIVLDKRYPASSSTSSAPSSPPATSSKVGAPSAPATYTAPANLPAQSTKGLHADPAIVEPVAYGAFPGVIIPDAVFEQSQKAADRSPVASVLVDWTDEDFTGLGADLSVVVVSIEIERSIVGELPEEANLVDGYTVATAKVVVAGFRAGAAMTIAQELSPFRTDSPLYAAALVTPDARIELGLLTPLGPKLYRQVTGPVRTIAISESAQTAQLSILDPAERIRESITLPTYGEFVSHANRRPWAITVNTQWVLVHVLRANGIHPLPPRRADAIIACTGTGGLVAEVGWNGAPISIYGDGPSAGLWTEDSNPWGLLATPENKSGGTVGYQELYGITDGKTAPMRFESGNGIGVSMWLHIGTYMTLGSSFENRILQIRPTEREYPRLFLSGYGDGSFYVGLTTASGSVYSTPRITTTSARWHHVGLHYRWTTDTNLAITVRVTPWGKAGTTTVYNVAVPSLRGSSLVTSTPFFYGYRPNLQINAQWFRAWMNLQAWVGPTAPALAEWQGLESWVPQADIGRGINELLYLPNVASADSWEVMKAAVGAEFGVHGFDPTGRYFFRPRTDARSSSDVDVYLDVTTDIADVAYSYSSDSVRNVVSYSNTPRYHSGDLRTVVQAQDVLQFTVPGWSVYYYEVDWPWGAAGYQGGILPYYPQTPVSPDQPVAGTTYWSDQIPHGWTYSTKGASGNWTIVDNVQSVVVKYVLTSSRTCLITVDNTAGGKDVRLGTAQPADASSDGTPSLHIGGWPIIDLPAHVGEYRDEASIVRHRGPRVYAMPSSDWRQTALVLDPMAKELVGAMSEPATLLEDLPVRGDPRTQVGMTCRLKFLAEASAPVYGVIVKTNRTHGDAGLVDKVSVRPLPEQTLAPAGWSFFVDISHYQYDGGTPIDLGRLYSLGYAGCIAKLGQGGGTQTVAASPQTFGNTIDPYWATARDTGRPLWGEAFAAYWFVGGTETAASQASRAAAAIGDKTIPIMLDWEDSGGTLSTVLAVRDAMRAQGLRVTMLYAGSGYVSNSAGGGNPTNIDATLGLYVIRARYWTNDQAHPRILFDDITDPAGFGLAPFNGATPDAFQFTQYGVVYPGEVIDVDAFPGTPRGLANMFQGRALTA